MSSSDHYFPPQGSTPRKDGNSFIFKPKLLQITWGGDTRNWTIPQDENSSDPAKLVQVRWLEVKGSLELSKLETNKEYTVTFNLSTAPDAFGWSGSPVYVIVWPGTNFGRRIVYERLNLEPGKSYDPKLKFKTGPELNPQAQLRFGIYEIWGQRWKGGLRIHEVVITKHEQ